MYMRRQPGVAAIILIGGLLMMMVALIGLVITFSNTIENTYMNLAFETPGFDYEITPGSGESGNEMFEAYQHIRIISFGVFVFVLIIAAIIKFIESSETGIMQQGTANRMMGQSLLFLLIILVFPPMWDVGVEAMKNISYWTLNPLYSFNPDSKCPESWSDADIRRAYLDSPYISSFSKLFVSDTAPVPGGGRSPPNNATSSYDFVCDPQLKVHYVFGQMLRATEDTNTQRPGTGPGTITLEEWRVHHNNIPYVVTVDSTDYTLDTEIDITCRGTDPRSMYGTGAIDLSGGNISTDITFLGDIDATCDRNDDSWSIDGTASGEISVGSHTEDVSGSLDVVIPDMDSNGKW